MSSDVRSERERRRVSTVRRASSCLRDEGDELARFSGTGYHGEVMTRAEVAQRTKEILVDGLRLEITPEEIVDADPIYGEGLGLDSIDVLEFVQLVEEEFGITISDEAVVRQAFASIDSLTDFILARTDTNASV